MISATTLSMSRIVAAYIDQTSEEMVAAYTQEREHWLRNQNAARAARIRRLLSGDRGDVPRSGGHPGLPAASVSRGPGVLGRLMRPAAADELTRLERAVGQVAVQAACAGEPVFLPRDDSSAWAWLPLGIRDRFDSAEASTAGVSADIRFAFGDRRRARAGSASPTCRPSRPSRSRSPPDLGAPRAVTFAEVAPVAMMLGIGGPAARLGAQHARGPGNR